jgi:hypothetical protein
MKRALWLVPVMVLFSLTGCAVRSRYYSRPSHEYWERDHYRHDHDRDRDRERDGYRRDR